MKPIYNIQGNLYNFNSFLISGENNILQYTIINAKSDILIFEILKIQDAISIHTLNREILLEAVSEMMQVALI